MRRHSYWLCRSVRDDCPDKTLTLAPVAVSPERQGKGIGSALIHQALEEAALGKYAYGICRGRAAILPPFRFFRRFGQPISKLLLWSPFHGYFAKRQQRCGRSCHLSERVQFDILR